MFSGLYKGLRHVVQAHMVLEDFDEPLPTKVLVPLLNTRFDEKVGKTALGRFLREMGPDRGIGNRRMTRGERDRWYCNRSRIRSGAHLFYLKGKDYIRNP